ncbi:MAG: copper chaperone PCu(A)C [Hyphomonadaceae bacterium]|nr:copper chaperone PCu(A)C [Hyphomonadaceae bacterium]
MMLKNVLALAFAFALAACGAPSTDPTPAAATAAEAPAALQVSDAWASATPGGATVSAGYFTITSPIEDRLVSASSPRAARVEIHEMAMDGDVMRMRAVDGGVELNAGESVTLAPGGIHLMFMDVTSPFGEGESVPVTLTFEQADAIDVVLPVRRRAEQHGR